MENKLVEIKGDIVTTTSINISENFGKQHKNVMRKVEALECTDKFRRLNFEPSSYVNAQGKNQPMYELTRDGFVYLAMGFTGKKAAEFKEKYITAFNTMEKRLMGKTSMPSIVDSSMVKLLAENMERVEKERDYALASKAQISDKKTATALQTASSVTRKYNGLKLKSDILSLQLRKSHRLIDIESKTRLRFKPFKYGKKQICAHCGGIIQPGRHGRGIPGADLKPWTNTVHDACFDSYIRESVLEKFKDEK